ncbi:hypothetical protein Bca4012_018200 [Brassica carinata]
MDPQPENDHLPSPALISDRVLINGVITPLTLTTNGELQWTESGRQKSTSEKEIRRGKKQEVACVCEPFGGKKTERKIFLEEGKPLFDDADVQLEIQETKYQFHAKEMVRFMDFSKYDGVIPTRRFSTMSIRPMPCFPPIVFSS